MVESCVNNNLLKNTGTYKNAVATSPHRRQNHHHPAAGQQLVTATVVKTVFPKAHSLNSRGSHRLLGPRQPVGVALHLYFMHLCMYGTPPSGSLLGSAFLRYSPYV